MPDNTGAGGPKPLESVAKEQGEVKSVTWLRLAVLSARHNLPPSRNMPICIASTADALEAAFQSVCHVCFRCHRSACPQCWDNVHRVCGACVQEAGLKFRTEAAPLAGLLFPPVRQIYSANKEMSAAPFVCIQPGRFAVDLAQSTDTETPEIRPSLDADAASEAVLRPSEETGTNSVGAGEDADEGLGRLRRPLSPIQHKLDNPLVDKGTRAAQAPQPLIIHRSRPYELSSEGLRRIDAQQAYEDVDDEPAGRDVCTIAQSY